jgi:MinD-like ATPase involved in chromosome partitioning or flagellar assembly
MNELSRTPRVIAVTGGKGGVGKTSIAINLAIALSRTGSKVCLFDGDTSLANTNIMLGLYPAYTLEHLFTGERSIQEIVIDGPEGIQIVPGASGVAQCVELDVGQQQRLVTSIRSIEKHYDYFLVDTAAGIGPTVLHFIAASQVALIVITPEPTSLTDAFSLLKVLKRRGYRRRVQIVVNMASNPSQSKKTYSRFSQAVFKYLNLHTEYLGSVWMDESMRNAVSTQKPVALFPKTDPSARCFYRIAESLDGLFERPSTPRLAFSEYWQKVVERQHRSKVVISRERQAKLPAPDLNVTNVSHEGALTQVQKQLRAKVEYARVKKNNMHLEVDQTDDGENHKDSIKVEDLPYSPYPPLNTDLNAELKDNATAPLNNKNIESESIITVSASNDILDDSSEHEWLKLRIQMNRFLSDPNTTPEQLITLFSSAIYTFGERLGNASVDLLHGLLHALDPEKLTEEQKQLLLSDYERIGLDAFKQEHDSRMKKARYDSEGFGDQQALVQAIRSSAADVPLESLLESIKYASLVDSSSN